jgi:hypothetical protein
MSLTSQAPMLGEVNKTDPLRVMGRIDEELARR